MRCSFNVLLNVRLTGEENNNNRLVRVEMEVHNKTPIESYCSQNLRRTYAVLLKKNSRHESNSYLRTYKAFRKIYFSRIPDKQHIST